MVIIHNLSEVEWISSDVGIALLPLFFIWHVGIGNHWQSLAMATIMLPHMHQPAELAQLLK
jgi:hypothetical protein